MKKVIFLVFTIYLISLFNNSQAQWVQVSNGINTNARIFSFAKLGNKIFTGNLSNGIYFSTNNGLNWTYNALSGQTISDFYIFGNTIFAAASLGIHYSTNEGVDWSNTTYNVIPCCFTSNGSSLFAGASNFGVYNSSNGYSWVKNGLDSMWVYSLAYFNGKLFAGTVDDYGTYMSNDNGQSWSKIEIINLRIFTFSIKGSNIFAGTNENGVYRSTDGGLNWEQSGLNGLSVCNLKSYGDYLYAGTWLNGFYVSSDDGASWTQRNEGFEPSTTINTLLISDNYIFAGTYSNSIWRRPLSEIITGTGISNEIPNNYRLFQNYPNPFNPVTNIKYQIANNKYVTIKVYDLLGKEVATLVEQKQVAGAYEVSWDGSGYSSGIYFYSLYADGIKIDTKRMILIK